MRRAYAVLLALLPAGCLLTNLNREGLTIIKDQTVKAQQSMVVALGGVKGVVDELSAAAAEDRPPAIAAPLKQTVEALATTDKSLNEVGQTAVTLQSGIGVSNDPPPQTSIELQAWRTKYMVLARIQRAAQQWAASKAPGIVPPPTSTPDPWSAGEAAGLITTVLALLGGGGVGGKKLVSSWQERKRAADEGQALAASLRGKLDNDDLDELLRKNTALKARLDKQEYDAKRQPA